MEKIKNFVTQTVPKVLSVLLTFLILLSMMDVRLLQGTAKTINCTGSARGMSQKLVKQEILGLRNDQMINDLTELLLELKEGGTTYGITPLRNVEYRSSVAVLTRYWDTLQEEIQVVRTQGVENSDILYVSEHFYELADQAVKYSEEYSTEITEDLRSIENLMVVVSILMILLMLFNTIQNRKLSTVNLELSHTAYLDKHTSLPNKSRCEELLNAPEELDLATACLMFDLNNLKKINDAMGHQAGDDMIKGFAHLLRKATPPSDFVGRYGGDEFIIIMKDVTPGDVDAFLEKLARMAADYNCSGTQFMPVIPLSYAVGYAHSAQVPNSTMPMLLKVADSNMYANKAKVKAAMKDQRYAEVR